MAAEVKGGLFAPICFAGSWGAVENGLAFAFQDRLQFARDDAFQADNFAVWFWLNRLWCCGGG